MDLDCPLSVIDRYYQDMVLVHVNMTSVNTDLKVRQIKSSIFFDLTLTLILLTNIKIIF